MIVISWQLVAAMRNSGGNRHDLRDVSAACAIWQQVVANCLDRGGWLTD